MLSNKGGHKIVKKIRANENKKIKWIYEFKNDLIIKKKTLNRIIKLFY